MPRRPGPRGRVAGGGASAVLHDAPLEGRRAEMESVAASRDDRGSARASSAFPATRGPRQGRDRAALRGPEARILLLRTSTAQRARWPSAVPPRSRPRPARHPAPGLRSDYRRAPTSRPRPAPALNPQERSRRDALPGFGLAIGHGAVSLPQRKRSRSRGLQRDVWAASSAAGPEPEWLEPPLPRGIVSDKRHLGPR